MPFIKSNKLRKTIRLIKRAIIGLGLLSGLLMGATILGFLFKSIGVHESNLIITYLLVVLLISYWIEGYLYGVLASVCSVLTFNFFFAAPYGSFLTYRQDYPVTFAIMLFSAVLVSTITSKMKRESRLSLIREKRAYVLYKMSQGLLRAQTIPDVCQVVGKEVSNILNVAVSITLNSEAHHLKGEWLYGKRKETETTYGETVTTEDEALFISDAQRTLIRQVYQTATVARYQKQYLDDLDFYYAPIIGQMGTLGVLGISLKPNEFIYEEKETLIQAMTSQVGMAIERVLISEAQQSQHMEIESERLRSNLLRAISHDLRTPLTGILGAATTLIAHDKLLSDVQKLSLTEDIAEDARWLVQSVENILSMTRFDEGKVQLNLKSELVDDIVLEALNRFEVNREINVNLPEILVAVQADGHLLQQVLVNLIDNAIKYTPNETRIDIVVKEAGEMVSFQVKDYGSGILEAHIPLLFNRFFTAGISSDRGKNGIGLGLEICKSIVEAHGGSIRAENHAAGGACFEFFIPKGGVVQ